MPTLRLASLHHKVNNPPSITRCRSIKETAALALFELCEIQRRQLSIATLRREIDEIVRCAPNVIKLSLPRAAHCSGGSTTFAPPLAAVAASLVMAGLTGHLAARGTVDNINVSDDDPA